MNEQKHTQKSRFDVLWFVCMIAGCLFILATLLGIIEQQSQTTARSTDPFWEQLSLWQILELTLGSLLLVFVNIYMLAQKKYADLFLRKQQQLEDDVNLQTEALHIANDWLLKEITERNAAQQALEASQERLKQRENELQDLLDSLPDPIWLKRLDGSYMNCNKTFAQLLGKTEADIIGKKETELFNAEQALTFLNTDMKALNSHSVYRYEQWLPQSDGKLHLMDTLKIALRNDKNESYSILGIARDITEKYELIDELQKFKRFAEFSSQGFGIASLNGETLYMNKIMRKMLNDYWLHSDFKQKFWLYYPEAVQEKVRDEIIPQVLEQGHWQGELLALHADGTPFPTQETFFVIRDERGKAQYIGNIMSDISAQKETERALSLAKEAAESSTKAKSRFLANMSHEIRTPLNAVLGYTQLLMRDANLTNHQRERLQLILTASQRLLGLINDILDLSKIESGLLYLRQDYFDVVQEIKDVHLIMHERATTKGLQLLLDIDLPEPCIVKGDRQKIGQILLNLIGNAIKFTTTGNVRVKVGRQDQDVEFVISDTGTGIAPEELSQLFSAFKQGQAGEDVGGTGLGLTLSRYLAEGMGGSLTLKSELGQGTNAYLRLPLPSETIIQPQLTQTLAQHIKPGTHCNVLVVEDDEASKEVLVDLLTQIGCATSAANNGREGLTLCENKSFDIIFTDIRMPDMNGVEMLKHIRMNPENRHAPVIAVSASSLEHERTYYLAQGFQDFIGKPYDFNDIFVALHHYAHAEFSSHQASDESTYTTSVTATETDVAITPLLPLLERLLEAAVSGDMTDVKQWLKHLDETKLGPHRYQPLMTAVRQYDLERVEQVVRHFIQEAQSINPSAT